MKNICMNKTAIKIYVLFVIQDGQKTMKDIEHK